MPGDYDRQKESPEAVGAVERARAAFFRLKKSWILLGLSLRL